MKRYLPFVIIVGVLIISTVSGMLIYRSAQPETKSSDASTATTSSTDFRNVRGEVNAPVTIEEFGDFQCPPCGALHPVLKKVEEEYGSRLRVVFHNAPVLALHKHALQAAHAAEAAGLQGRFWEMHDLLFERQREWSESGDARTLLIGYARTLGLDMERFARDMEGEEAARRISADKQRGLSVDISGTPTLFLNGLEIPAESMTSQGIRDRINSALNGKGP